MVFYNELHQFIFLSTSIVICRLGKYTLVDIFTQELFSPLFCFSLSLSNSILNYSFQSVTTHLIKLMLVMDFPFSLPISSNSNTKAIVFLLSLPKRLQSDESNLQKFWQKKEKHVQKPNTYRFMYIHTHKYLLSGNDHLLRNNNTDTFVTYIHGRVL